jgi:hypothetical protein
MVHLIYANIFIMINAIYLYYFILHFTYFYLLINQFLSLGFTLNLSCSFIRIWPLLINLSYLHHFHMLSSNLAPSVAYLIYSLMITFWIKTHN